MRSHLILLPLLLAFFTACDGSSTDSEGSGTAADTSAEGSADTSAEGSADTGAAGDTSAGPITIDDFATIPEPREGDWQIDFPERTIDSGADIMACLYLEPTQQDIWVRAAHEYQGQNGHHLLLFQAVVQRPAGTIADCTSEESMASLMASVFTDNFAGGALPEGYAVKVPAGTQLVVQQHYVNATVNNLRVRDAMVLETLPGEAVQTPINFFALTRLTFEVPNDRQEHSVEHNCTVPEDNTRILLFGPHMHEWGTHIEIEKVDAAGVVHPLHQVEQWRADYRDLPPVARYFDDPLVLNASDTVRLRCTWSNDLDRSLRFPKEMCAVYGYFLAPSGQNWICAE